MNPPKSKIHNPLFFRRELGVTLPANGEVSCAKRSSLEEVLIIMEGVTSKNYRNSKALQKKSHAPIPGEAHTCAKDPNYDVIVVDNNQLRDCLGNSLLNSKDY
jgi:hypothetical protein